MSNRQGVVLDTLRNMPRHGGISKSMEMLVEAQIEDSIKMEERMKKVEESLESVRTDVNDIKKDISYIKDILENRACVRSGIFNIMKEKWFWVWLIIATMAVLGVSFGDVGSMLKIAVSGVF